MKKVLLIFCILFSSCSFYKDVIKEIDIEVGEVFPSVINNQKIIAYENYDPHLLTPQTVLVTYENDKSEKIIINNIDTTKPEAIPIKAFLVYQNSEINLEEYFNFIDNSQLPVTVAYDSLDSSQLGKHQVTITLSDQSNNQDVFTTSYQVIDSNNIYITQLHRFEIKKDATEIDIEQFFSTNSISEHLAIKGEYDLNKVGSYPIEIKTDIRTLPTILHVSTSKKDADKYAYSIIEPTEIRNDNLILVNKRYKLAADYVPDNLASVPAHMRVNNQKLTLETLQAFIKIREAGLDDGINLIMLSGYRAYNSQAKIYQNYKNSNPRNVDRYSARPGHSEHQLGTVIDFCFGYNKCLHNFTGTKADDWMKKNAHRYGFIKRYPKNKEDITGYQSESWHYRYVGVDVATHLKKLGITYDEYYFQFISSKY